MFLAIDLSYPSRAEVIMRLTSLLSVALLVSLATSATAQEWIEFVSRDDGFRSISRRRPL